MRKRARKRKELLSLVPQRFNSRHYSSACNTGCDTIPRAVKSFPLTLSLISTCCCLMVKLPRRNPATGRASQCWLLSCRRLSNILNENRQWFSKMKTDFQRQENGSELALSAFDKNEWKISTFFPTMYLRDLLHIKEDGRIIFSDLLAEDSDDCC